MAIENDDDANGNWKYYTSVTRKIRLSILPKLNVHREEVNFVQRRSEKWQFRFLRLPLIPNWSDRFQHFNFQIFILNEINKIQI